jgi:SAM-dependent methyltransferase
MSEKGGTRTGPLLFPREKPHRLFLALAYRLYSLLHPILPRRWMLRTLLESSWLTRVLAWEQLWRSLPAAEALALSRPHTLAFVEAAIPSGATVIDLGGGTGVIAATTAARASRVLVTDSSATALASARTACAGLANVEFAEGDMLEVLAERGSFDVALLLHGLGYFRDPEATLRQIGRQVRRLVLELPDFRADALNAARLREGLPAWSDAAYVAEYDTDSLGAVLTSAGWIVRELYARDGHLFAVADATPDRLAASS